MEATSRLLPMGVKVVVLNGLQNLLDHQLSSVRVVVPIWFAVM
jgi:hypothetical protein